MIETLSQYTLHYGVHIHITLSAVHKPNQPNPTQPSLLHLSIPSSLLLRTYINYSRKLGRSNQPFSLLSPLLPLVNAVPKLWNLNTCGHLHQIIWGGVQMFMQCVLYIQYKYGLKIAWCLRDKYCFLIWVFIHSFVHYH